MDSTPVNWEALDSIIINFAKSEHLIEDSSSGPSSPTSSSSASSSPSSSSSYRSRLLILQIRRNIEAGKVDAAIDILQGHAPVALEDHRILFRLQKQKFIELLRRGTEKDRDCAIQCLRRALAPCALDAYPEAYEEFKHALLALIFDKDDQYSPVANEWSERRRSDLAGLLSSILRAHLQAYDPIFSMTLRYLISIHKVFCLRQGISSPIFDLTERLLFEDRDPPATSQESLYDSPPFDEVDIQALAHAVELTRQGAVDSLRFTKGDLFQAFQNELCRMRLDFSILDELVHEYFIYRGITDCTTIVSLLEPDLSNSYISRFSDGEASINNVGTNGLHEDNADHGSILENDSDMRSSSDMMTNNEDCSTSGTSRMQSCPRRLRRSRYEASREERRKRWRGRFDTLERTSDINISGKGNQQVVPSGSVATGDKYGKDKVSKSSSSFNHISSVDIRKYETILEIKELVSKGMAAEVVEEVTAVDPEFFTQNPYLLFHLKQVEFSQLVNSGSISQALKVACAHLGPLAARNECLIKPLKETLLLLLKPNEESLSKGIPWSTLANTLQVAMGRRLGVEEPQLMKIMRATLHTHTEWFKLQMCKDRFEGFLKIDCLKEISVPIRDDATAKAHADNSLHTSSQVTTSSSNKLGEDISISSQASSSENIYDENAILKVMEFLALPRADAIHLLMQYNGNAETVIQQIFS
ncbi:hypothetical protein AXF42_Ash002397 [Apostasia shenzhenica]|uniref:CTLH domain-containing protein n=1 Tax=Apostasia shenzhenica TaxID=1088818 RepID=A0A2I0ANH6_9ASPA|nr:hypothetical protein AXF42_Ash002397 [Apostasia shenzhenica]